ncbi:MAG TPA: BrxA/BrxB family bacilliredoxin [Thermoanaerobaculia bacterium]|jgi:putative YphP/YqiW family bacilliredoxin
MPYPELMIKPFREELTTIGFEELTTAADVDRWMEQNRDGEPALLVINSVCGCAAGMARPGVRLALREGARPQRLATVFAGQDVEATATARGYFPDVPPSSPSMALWKDGEVVYFLPRHRIEGRGPEQVAADLRAAFEEHCAVAAS